MTAPPDTSMPSSGGGERSIAILRQGGDLPAWLIEGIAHPFPVITAGRIAAASLMILTSFAVLVPVYPMGRLVTVGPIPAMGWFALLAAVLTGLTLVRGGLRTLPVGPIPIVAAAFLTLYASVSLAVGAPNVQLLILTWTLWAAAFLLAAATPRHLAMWVIGGWIGLALFVTLYAVYEQLARPRLLYRDHLVQEYDRLFVQVGDRRLLRAQATFGHPAPLASFLATTASTALWAFPIPRHLLARLARVAIVCILMVGLAATLTRGGTLALVVAVGIGLIIPHTSGHLKLAVLFGGLTLAIALAPTPLGDAIVRYGEDVDELARSPGRVATVRSLPDILTAAPVHVLIGWGGNSRQELYDRGIIEASNNFEVIDNQYITILTEVGLLGLGLFLALILLALRTAWTIHAWWTFGLGAALLALLTAIFFYEGLNWPSTAILFWSIIGFLAREARLTSDGGPL